MNFKPLYRRLTDGEKAGLPDGAAFIRTTDGLLLDAHQSTLRDSERKMIFATGVIKEKV